MEKRTKGYGKFINGKKTYDAKYSLTIYKSCGNHWYNDITEVNFEDFNCVKNQHQSLEGNNGEYVLKLKTLTGTHFVDCTFNDLFGICFNSRILNSVPSHIQDFVLVQTIRIHEYLRFVVTDDEVIFYQSNKSKGARNEYKIRL